MAAARTLNEGRSLNPGDTARAFRDLPPARHALNEGRSLNPGDTRREPVQHLLDVRRSTKAGV